MAKLEKVQDPDEYEFDPWTTDDSGGYSLDRRYNRAVDNKGHQVETRVKAIPSIAAQISRLVASGRIPEYRTPADVYRDAVIHRLHYLNKTVLADPDLHAALDIEMRLARQEKNRAERAGLAKLVSDYRRDLEEARYAKDRQGLAQIRHDIAEDILLVREPYSSQLAALYDESGRA